MRNTVELLVGMCLVLVALSAAVAVEPEDIPELARNAMQYRTGQWESIGYIDGVEQAKPGKETTKWTPGQYAISVVGYFYEEGKEVHATGLIGWDPEVKQLVEHWYASDGSKSTFSYTLDADKKAGIGTFQWVYADGRKYEGKSVVQIITDDEWEWNASYVENGKEHTWRSINRRVKNGR